MPTLWSKTCEKLERDWHVDSISLHLQRWMHCRFERFRHFRVVYSSRTNCLRESCLSNDYYAMINLVNSSRTTLKKDFFVFIAWLFFRYSTSVTCKCPHAMWGNSKTFYLSVTLCSVTWYWIIITRILFNTVPSFIFAQRFAEIYNAHNIIHKNAVTVSSYIHYMLKDIIVGRDKL